MLTWRIRSRALVLHRGVFNQCIHTNFWLLRCRVICYYRLTNFIYVRIFKKVIGCMWVAPILKAWNRKWRVVTFTKGCDLYERFVSFSRGCDFSEKLSFSKELWSLLFVGYKFETFSHFSASNSSLLLHTFISK